MPNIIFFGFKFGAIYPHVVACQRFYQNSVLLGLLEKIGVKLFCFYCVSVQ